MVRSWRLPAPLVDTDDALVPSFMYAGGEAQIREDYDRTVHARLLRVVAEDSQTGAPSGTSCLSTAKMRARPTWASGPLAEGIDTTARAMAGSEGRQW